MLFLFVICLLILLFLLSSRAEDGESYDGGDVGDNGGGGGGGGGGGRQQQSAASKQLDVKSPFFQSLPNCGGYAAFPNLLSKVTSAKAGVCVMIKDEAGFLAEFVAFYHVMGVDHIIFYDDNSTDTSMQELAPFISAGWASVKTNWEGYDGVSASTWGKQMKQKKMMERDCKLTLHSWDYDYHISVDMDEFELPIAPNVTLVDAIHNMFLANPKRGVFSVDKWQFSAHPHIFEPYDKLTIEAYQNRYHSPNRFSNKKGLMRKSVYRLRRSDYSNNTLKFVLECCTFHSCKQGPLPFCWDLQKTEMVHVFNPPYPKSAFQIFHYARSLEKFVSKQKTWKQHVNAGYGLEKYFERSHGWTFDNRALRYACQVRHVLSNMTGIRPYFRPGNWTRKYEQGKNPYMNQ